MIGSIDKESGILNELLQSFDENIELLAFLLSNESVPEGLLTSLYERRVPFNELADEQWLEAIRLTALNDAIKQSGDAAWKLFAILPVNKKSAFVLSGLGRTLAPHGEWSFPSAPDDMDVRETIKRWGAEKGR